LQASDTLCGIIVVTWDDVELEDGYIVRRNGIVIGSTGANETTFMYAASPAHAAFRVQAINPCGASFGSAIDSGGTEIAPTFYSLFTSSPDCDGISLSFAASANTDSVRLWRDATLIATVSGGAGAYEDSPPPGSYSYTAQAVGGCGESEVSEGVPGALLAYPSGPFDLAIADNGCDVLSLAWTPAAGDFGHYDVYRDGELLASLMNTDTTFADSNVIGGVEYMYRVTAVNDTCGAGVNEDSVLAIITLSAAPAAPEVVITTDNLDALLQWSSADTTVAGCPIQASRYLVFFSENSEGPYYYHGSTANTSYRHVEVLRFAQDMYYVVETFVGDVAMMTRIPDNGAWTMEEVQREMRKQQ